MQSGAEAVHVAMDDLADEQEGAQLGKKKQHTKKKRRDHSTSPAKLGDARSLYDAGHFEEAIEVLHSELEREETRDKRALLCMSLERLSRYEEAIAVAAKFDPQTSGTYQAMGWWHYELKNYEAALRMAEQSLQMGETGDGYYLLACSRIAGRREWTVNQPERSSITEVLGKAISLKDAPPDAFYTYQDWDTIEETGHTYKERWIQYRQRLLAAWQKGVNLYPHSTDMRCQLANCYLLLDQYECAMSVLEPVLTAEPDLPTLWMAMRVTRCLEDWNGQLRFITAMEQQTKAVSCLSVIKGDALRDAGNHAQAETYYRQAIQSGEPEHRYAGHFGIALVLLLSGQTTTALKHVTVAIEERTKAGADLTSFNANLSLDYQPYYDTQETVRQACRLLREQHDNKQWNNPALLAAIYATEFEVTGHGDNELIRRAWSLSHEPYVAEQARYALFENKDMEEGVEAWLIHLVHEVSCADQAEYRSPRSLCLNIRKDDPLPFTSKQARTIHHRTLVHLRAVKDDKKLVSNVFAPFYGDIWRPLLLEHKLYTEWISVCEALTAWNPDDLSVIFDLGYCSQMAGEARRAEDAYRLYLRTFPESESAYNNLAILLEAENRLEEALTFFEKAASLAADPKKFEGAIKRLREHITRQQREVAKQEAFLMTAPERWGQLNHWQRQLLSALATVKGFDGFKELAQLTGMDERYVGGHWSKLVQMGMIIANGATYKINPHIADLVQSERSHVVVTRLIHSDNRIVFKPVFNSNLEYTAYRILIGIFPNHLVFPNMSLQSIFQYDRMKELLGSEDFRYFLMSQVDYCVISTSSYLPVLGIEMDSQYHENQKQKVRDDRKDRIFQTGGVPLIRVRPFGRASDQQIRLHIANCIREAIPLIRQIESAASNYMNLRMELNLEALEAGEVLDVDDTQRLSDD